MEKKCSCSNRALSVVAVLGVLAVCYFASSLLIPIAGAFFLSLLFLPVVRKAKAVGLSSGLASTLIVIFLTVVLLTGLIALGEAAQRWAVQAPEMIEKVEKKIQGAKKPLADLKEATTKLEDITAISESEEVRPIREREEDVGTSIRSGELIGRVFSGSMNLVLGLAICLILTLFILAAGDDLERGFRSSSSEITGRLSFVRAKRELEVVLGRYLRARSAINLGLGLLLWPVFYFLGVANPLLWAIIAAFLNFIPYIGAAILFVLLIAAGMVTQETFWEAIRPAIAFALINSVEGMVVSPIVIGRWMKLNTIAVFLAVVSLGWFWGIAGALMAVPALLVFCSICEQTDRWRFLSAFISLRETSDGA